MKNSQWLLLALVSLSVPAAETYRLDSTNTQVAFSVESLGIQWVSAHFTDIRGDFRVDPTGAGSQVDVTVAVSSLTCSEPRWNERLRSAEWLDVRRFPHMTYHSSVIRMDDRGGIASGELTLHGTTRPILLDVSLHSCTSAGLCRFSARGRIKRSEFGLPHGFWTGGDQVDIAISGAIVRNQNRQ